MSRGVGAIPRSCAELASSAAASAFRGCARMLTVSLTRAVKCSEICCAISIPSSLAPGIEVSSKVWLAFWISCSRFSNHCSALDRRKIVRSLTPSRPARQRTSEPNAATALPGVGDVGNRDLDLPSSARAVDPKAATDPRGEADGPCGHVGHFKLGASSVARLQILQKERRCPGGRGGKRVWNGKYNTGAASVGWHGRGLDGTIS